MIARVVVSRCFIDSPVDQTELHLFGDNSQDDQCSVTLLRGLTVVTNEIKNSFFIGKADVATIKVYLKPKLELQAAVLASRMRLEIEKSMTIRF